MTQRENTKNSARLIDQRGSYAFRCRPISIHVRQIWPTSDIYFLVY